MAGVRASRKRSEILAFADGGCRVSKGWLQCARGAARRSRRGREHRILSGTRPSRRISGRWCAASGMRPLPACLGPATTRLRGPVPWPCARIRSSSCGIPDVWRFAASEDGALARAVRAAGRRISFAPGAMAACTGRISAGAFLGWARRQMVLARLYVPRLWWGALGSHIFYCGGMAAAITASVRGSRGAEWVLVVQLGLGMLKGVNRATLARAELPDFEAWFKRHAWVHCSLGSSGDMALAGGFDYLCRSAFPERKRESSSQRG